MKKLDKKSIEDVLALTPMQEGMLVHYLKDPGSEYYFEQLSLEISGEINMEVFEKAWNFVIENNEMLRAVFCWEQLAQPVQIILKKHKFQPRYYDIVDSDIHNSEKRLEEIKNIDRKEKFDLREVPLRVTLCRIAKKKHLAIISNHHILYDGWSNGIIMKEFFNTYSDLSRGKELVKPVKTKFKEFIKWRQDQDDEVQKQYWKNYLNDLEDRSFLSLSVPTFSQIPAKKSKHEDPGEAAHYPLQLREGITKEIYDFTRKRKISLASLLYSAWGILLYKYCGTGDVVFGVTTANRPSQVKGIENSVGLFINTLPLRIRIKKNTRVREILKQVSDWNRARIDFQWVSMVEVNKYPGNNHDLFDTIIVMENYPLLEDLCTGSDTIKVDSYSLFERTHYFLTLTVSTFKGIGISFEYNPRVLDVVFIENSACHFQNIIQSITKKTGEILPQIDWLDEDEKKRLLYEFNNTRADFPGNKTVHELFANQAGQTPDNIAVVFKNRRITYRCLNERANQLAKKLRNHGIQADTVVGIMLTPSVERILAVMAIIKSGGVYLPIDPGLPPSRTRYLLQDSGAVALVTRESFYGKNKVIPVETIHDNVMFIYDESYPGDMTNPPSINRADDLIYVNYTSGTTGRPMGVMIRHKSVSNYMHWLRDALNIKVGTRFLTLTDYTFDASVMDIFGSLLHGAVLFVGERDLIFNRSHFKEYVENNRICMVDFVPRVLNELLCYEEKLTPLHTIVVGGEELDPSIKDRIINKGYTLFNHYGPTETTVDALAARCSGKKVTLGKPIANCRCYIVRERSLVPMGIPGEICISGAGLARGYLNQPELTAERFTGNPLLPGQRMYRTGDLGRWLADGDVEFIGRIDHQVKIRGIRVELAEIESQIRKHPRVKDVAVVIDKTKTSAENLYAFVQPERPAEKPGAEKELPGIRLREYLEKELPGYMIPVDFIMVDKIPLTPNGKLDRKALSLAKTRAADPVVRPGDAGPGNHTERIVAEIWQELLGIDKVGINDDFFKLGGNSLLVIRLFSQLNRRFPQRVKVQDLFDHRTIKKLSQAIMAKSEAESDAGGKKIRTIDF